MPKRLLVTILLGPHGSLSVGMDKNVPDTKFRGKASYFLIQMTFLLSRQQS